MTIQASDRADHGICNLFGNQQSLFEFLPSTPILLLQCKSVNRKLTSPRFCFELRKRRLPRLQNFPGSGRTRSLRGFESTTFQRLQLFNSRISLHPLHRDAYSLDPNAESRFGLRNHRSLASRTTFQQNSKHMLGRRRSGVRIGMFSAQIDETMMTQIPLVQGIRDIFRDAQRNSPSLAHRAGSGRRFAVLLYFNVLWCIPDNIYRLDSELGLENT